VSNSWKYQGDWGDDSASLFRDARHAHDPTPRNRASFDRVFQRIDAAGALQPKAATRAVAVAKLSVVVFGVVAAGYLASGGAGRDSSVRATDATPDTTEHAALPAPAPQDNQDEHDKTAELQPASAPPISIRDPREETSSRTAPRRSRVSTGRQRAAKNEAAVVTDLTASFAQDEAPSAVQRDAPQAETSPQRSAPSEDTEQRQPAKRESAPPPEPSAQQPAELAQPKPSVAPPAFITELTLLKRMQAALRAADFTSALAMCAEHAQRWPQGTFALERKGVHAIAACSLRTDDAFALAKRFLTSHPHASMAMRVSSACRKQLQQGH
jgi:hypothetical protein